MLILSFVFGVAASGDQLGIRSFANGLLRHDITKYSFNFEQSCPPLIYRLSTVIFPSLAAAWRGRPEDSQRDPATGASAQEQKEDAGQAGLPGTVGEGMGRSRSGFIGWNVDFILEYTEC